MRPHGPPTVPICSPGVRVSTFGAEGGSRLSVPSGVGGHVVTAAVQNRRGGGVIAHTGSNRQACGEYVGERGCEQEGVDKGGVVMERAPVGGWGAQR